MKTEMQITNMPLQSDHVSLPSLVGARFPTTGKDLRQLDLLTGTEGPKFPAEVLDNSGANIWKVKIYY